MLDESVSDALCMDTDRADVDRHPPCNTKGVHDGRADGRLENTMTFSLLSLFLA